MYFHLRAAAHWSEFIAVWFLSPGLLFRTAESAADRDGQQAGVGGVFAGSRASIFGGC